MKCLNSFVGFFSLRTGAFILGVVFLMAGSAILTNTIVQLIREYQRYPDALKVSCCLTATIYFLLCMSSALLIYGLCAVKKSFLLLFVSVCTILIMNEVVTIAIVLSYNDAIPDYLALAISHAFFALIGFYAAMVVTSLFYEWRDVDEQFF